MAFRAPTPCPMNLAFLRRYELQKQKLLNCQQIVDSSTFYLYNYFVVHSTKYRRSLIFMDFPATGAFRIKNKWIFPCGNASARCHCAVFGWKTQRIDTFLPAVEWLLGHSTKAFRQWPNGRAQKCACFLSCRRCRDILTEKRQEQTNDRKNRLLYR